MLVKEEVKVILLVEPLSPQIYLELLVTKIIERSKICLEQHPDRKKLFYPPYRSSSSLIEGVVKVPLSLEAYIVDKQADSCGNSTVFEFSSHIKVIFFL